MATRTIVTSQPDVACYVCGRRLLRGEQPEVFLAGGRPRTVCELCAPRAANAGWAREVEGDPVGVAPLRPRRGRGIFDRLRQVGRAADAPPRAAGKSSSHDREPDRYDFLEHSSTLAAEPLGGSDSDQAHELRSQGDPAPAVHRDLPVPAERRGTGGSDPWDASLDDVLDRSIEVFNAGEYPRRVAGLARSLGVPDVSVRLLEGVPNVVEIVVAWELCWYRYRVDLDDIPAEAHVRAQGTDLAELAREDLLVNAAVNELGTLSLSGMARAGG